VEAAHASEIGGLKCKREETSS